jgi:hypothetical protein
MSEIIGGTHIREGVDSIELTSDDIFDRIINLKFIRESGRSFTIRSDYEPVFHKDDTISFRKCTQKPDIKISYTQVKDVGIEIYIEIKNFQLEGADSAGQDWGAYAEETAANGAISVVGGDPVKTCIIQMGYRAQFPNWTDDNYKKNIDQYYDLNNSAIVSSGSPENVKPPVQLVVQILAAYPTSYPPDRTMLFQGAVGSFETGLRWEHSADDLITGFGDASFPEDLSEIESYLFYYVKRRFVRSGVVHKQKTEERSVVVDGKKETRYTQTIKIYEDKKTSETGETGDTSETGENTGWRNLTLDDNGLMSVDDANKYGVVCACSLRLRSVAANALYGYGLTEKQAAAIRPVPPTPFDDLQETVTAQLSALRQHFPFLRWFLLNDGSYFFYHDKETEKELWTDAFVKEQQQNAVVLPAVYDITPEGVRTIRCPFITWVHPTTTVLFRSRFNKGTFTGYFYPVKTKAFLVITSEVHFATVEDVNEMTMTCCDIADKDAPTVDPETGEIVPKPSEETSETPKVAKLQQERDLQWTKKTLDVVLHKTNATNTDSTWVNIVENEVRPLFKPENWPEGQVFTPHLALSALKDWNPDYFDPDKEYMKRSDSVHGESLENAPTGIGGQTGIKVSWLKVGDKIVVRSPFQAEYPDDEEVVV